MDGQSNPQTGRTLSQEDVDAILDAFENRFYTRAGKTFVEIVRYGLVALAIAVAAYGYHVKG
jgi:hypothetical protein